jgi:hypothetical protein
MTPPQYRFSQDLVYVEVAGAIRTDVSTGNMNNITFFTFPPNYRPLLAQKWFVNSVADGAASPVCSVAPSGAVQLNFLPGSISTTQIGITGRYVLDDQFGFIQS